MGYNKNKRTYIEAVLTPLSRFAQDNAVLTLLSRRNSALLSFAPTLSGEEALAKEKRRNSASTHIIWNGNGNI